MIFDHVRRQHADWYTAHPADSLSTKELERLAAQAGITVDELRRHLSTPHAEMTCPLCGRPQTHLTSCKGCGGDAWGWECELAHGEDFAGRLRQQLQQMLAQAEGVTQEQAQYAVGRAYTMGGCMICPACWRDTSLDWESYLTCPLNLFSSRQLDPYPYQHLQMLLVSAGDVDPRAIDRLVERWIGQTWSRWVTNAHGQWLSAEEARPVVEGPGGDRWVVAPEAAIPEVVKGWRQALLTAALSPRKE